MIALGYSAGQLQVGKLSHDEYQKLYEETKTAVLQEAAPSLLPQQQPAVPQKTK
jgi:hypothetical protein